MDEKPKPRPGNKIVEGETIHLDYQTFKNHSFVRCKLIYGGGRPPSLVECDFIQTEFIFENQALATLTFLAAVAAQPGGRNFVLLMLGITDNG